MLSLFCQACCLVFFGGVVGAVAAVGAVVAILLRVKLIVAIITFAICDLL